MASTINTDDIIREIRDDTGMRRYEIERVVQSLFSNIAFALNHGKTVRLPGFGTFEMKHRAPRTGRNPHTGEAVPIPERDIPSFSPSNSLKNMTVRK